MFSAPFEQSFGVLTRRRHYFHECIIFEDLLIEKAIGIVYEQVIYFEGTCDGDGVSLEVGNGCKIQPT